MHGHGGRQSTKGEAGAGGSGGARVRQGGGGRRGGHDVRDLSGPAGEAGQGAFVWLLSRVVIRSHVDFKCMV